MLIKNGTILSPGTKKEWQGDLRIKNGEITELGTLTPDGEEKVLNAGRPLCRPRSCGCPCAFPGSRTDL